MYYCTIATCAATSQRRRLLSQGGEHHVDKARLAVAHESEDANVAGAVAVSESVDNLLQLFAHSKCMLARVQI